MRRPPVRRSQQPNWVTVGLGIITVATLIAAVAVGAYVTVVVGQGSFAFLADRTGWASSIFAALMATLFAYLLVVTAGMNTVFNEAPWGRMKEGAENLTQAPPK